MPSSPSKPPASPTASGTWSPIDELSPHQEMESAKPAFTKRMVVYEVIAFTALITFIWIDEALDIPYHFWGAEQTPPNWHEAAFESFITLVIAIITIRFTVKLFRRMRYLEGIVPICSRCKKIRDDKGYWQQLEEYVEDKSGAQFSHGLCEQCADELYGDKEWYQRAKKRTKGEPKKP